MVQTQPLFDLETSLLFGDNLKILRRYVDSERADLIYLDPPFNSNATYNMLFRHIDGTPAAAQMKAFTDTWTWNVDSERAYKEAVEGGGQLSLTMEAFRSMLGTNNMFAYLCMMAPRLAEMHRVLKLTGTIYLHCDPTASHYLKILMDAIFGAKNFRNEIVWCYAGGGIPKNDFPRKHDIILRYSKTNKYFYKPVYRPYSPGTVQRGRTQIKGKYFDAGLRPEGTPVNDWWTDVPKITSPTDPENIGYPTQKSLALLERIILTSCPERGVVLDPFCGCGTAVDAAQKLNRQWIGIDIAELAIRVIRKRMDTEHPNVPVKIRGIPTTLDEVNFLAELDKFAFQQWVCDVLGIQTIVRKGKDGGIDGELVFYQVEGSEPIRAIVSVKGGATGPAHVRELRGTISDRADIGIFVCRKTPTRDMQQAALSAGLTESGTPRVQIMTARDLIEGQTPQLPIPVEVGQVATRETATEQTLALRHLRVLRSR
jgi:site-specific DNA-methyltransferase (adenine-specific)